ncbi:MULTISPECIES: hypothetical protein [Salinibaculum]|uniref:hypothetical protein n=1 Tax=Salinibaculum TaxID=2732368 RepID=UPI0030D5AE4B
MDRRTFLATGLAGAGLATAGCSGLLGSTVPLTVEETEPEDEGREKYLICRHDGQRILAVGFDQRSLQRSPTDDFGFRITNSHDDTKIESFTVDLRAPRTSVDPPANIYLKAPSGGLWPDLTYEEVEDLWTRIELDDTGELGEGTLNLETLVDPNATPVTEVGIRVEMELSSTESGRRYTLDTVTEFEPVVERS